MKKILQAGPSITNLEKSYVNKMMNDGWDSYQYVEEFQKKFAEWHDRKYALMTPNEISRKGITLPSHYNLEEDQLEYICDKLIYFIVNN